MGDTSNWILGSPMLLDTIDGVNYYLGTQLGNAGTTLQCENCKSVVRYYYPARNDDGVKVGKILSAKICPFCHGSAEVASRRLDIIKNMTKCLSEVKKQLYDEISDRASDRSKISKGDQPKKKKKG